MHSELLSTAAIGCLLTLSQASCSSDSNTSEEQLDAAARDGVGEAEHRCVADVIEPDLAMGPMGGSAVDEQTGFYRLEQGQEVVVSSTYGVPKPDATGGGLPPHYQDLMGRIIEQLQTQPGLLAVQLGGSASCNSGRTLAVWESEELMYDFVMSAPHLEAMSSAQQLLQPGYAVTHWSARTQDEMSLEAAADHLSNKLERQ